MISSASDALLSHCGDTGETTKDELLCTVHTLRATDSITNGRNVKLKLFKHFNHENAACNVLTANYKIRKLSDQLSLKL